MSKKLFGALVSALFLMCGFLSFAVAEDTIPRAGLKLWITADSVQMTGAEVAKIYDLSGSNNSPTHFTDVPNITTVPSIVKVANKYNGHAVLHFPGSYTGFTFTTIAGIRSVFAVLFKDSTSCEINGSYETAGACCDISPKFWLGDMDGTTNFHADHGCCIFRNDFGEVSPCVARDGFVSINGGPKIAQPTLTFMPFHLSLLTILASCGVQTSTIARDRTMSDRSFQGDIAEILIYNTVLDTPTVKKIQNILGVKYGLPGFKTATTVPPAVSGLRPTSPAFTIIYPNTKTMALKFSGTGDYSIKVFNTKGQMVFEKNGDASEIVSLNNDRLSSGYYYLSATVNTVGLPFGSFIVPKQ